MERKLAKKSSSKKNTVKDVDLKSSTINILLNTVIFILFAVVVYMSYSIYIKLADKESTKIPLIEPAASEIIQLEVLNGCGVTGVADRVTDYLRNKNFDVVYTDNFSSFDVQESSVIDRTGNIANAKKVAGSLGITRPEMVFTQVNESDLLDVQVIIGKDYIKLNPFK